MFKTLTTVRRRSPSNAFFHEAHPPDQARNAAIHELYIKTGKLLSVNHSLSEDKLTFEVRMTWDCEQSFIDFFTSDNKAISSFSDRFNQYNEEQGLLADITVEE